MDFTNYKTLKDAGLVIVTKALDKTLMLSVTTPEVVVPQKVVETALPIVRETIDEIDLQIAAQLAIKAAAIAAIDSLQLLKADIKALP
jgi:hypothetical protein